MARLGKIVLKVKLTAIVKSFFKVQWNSRNESSSFGKKGVDSDNQKVLSFNIRINEGRFKTVSKFEFKNLSPEATKLLENILTEVDKPYFDSGKYNKEEIEFIQVAIVEKLKRLGYLDPKVSLKSKESLGNESIEIEVESGR